MKSSHLRACLALILTSSAGYGAPAYAVVASQAAQDDPAWRAVCDKLSQKHEGALVLTWKQSPAECLDSLKKAFPRHVCFLARPAEATEAFVRAVHQLTRKFDDDPYTDCLWGILTGFDAANALQIASENNPLTIRKVASGTEVALDRCQEGVWYCELRQGRMVRKSSGAQPAEETAPRDTTEALAKTLTDYQADLFVTSGHATERDWQIGYSYKNGSWRSKAGELFGVDTAGRKIPIHSDHPRVFMPIGNCLMGHIDGPDAMALAFMKSAGVRQMLGYVVPTWFGYQGWGCLDYFVEQPGRFTFAEAFFANHHALIHRLAANPSNSDRKGLEFDRDVVAFYGDPAWEARMAPGSLSWKQELTNDGDAWTFSITPLRGRESFATVNANGAQRGGRPIVQFLPRRIDPATVTFTAGQDLNPLATDDFLLVPLPTTCDPTRRYEVKFTAKPQP
jgi:zinc protease